MSLNKDGKGQMAPTLSGHTEKCVCVGREKPEVLKEIKLEVKKEVSLADRIEGQNNI